MHGLIFASLRDYTAGRLGEDRAAELWAEQVFETTEVYDDRHPGETGGEAGTVYFDMAVPARSA